MLSARFAFVICLMFCTAFSHAQETIKVMSYNVLNFPQGDMLDRQDTLALILNEIQPDLLLLQELKSEAGLLQIAEESCADLDGEYIASVWEPLQSNPTSSWPLQQGLVYNNSVMGMVEEAVILTSYRDVNAFRMFVRNEATLAGDTSYINVFVTHLKSSQGTDNEALRNEMAEAFVTAMNDYDPDVPAIFAGDFNIYTSDEPAYQTLLDAGNSVVFVDPIDAPGNWTDSAFNMPEVLTQSTRTSQIYGDGAGGGLDDRFDFALLSENLLADTPSDLYYVDGSYTAYGNTGLCYDGSLPACETDDGVPADITWALYHMSDHLPIVFEIGSTRPIPDVVQEAAKSTFPSVHMHNGSFRLRIPHANWKGTLRVLQSDGRVIYEQTDAFTHGQHLQFQNASGMLLFQWTTEQGQQFVQRVVG